MSTTAQPKTSSFRWMTTLVNSTIGAKYLIGATGALLVGFVIVHMIGNLQIFAGREAVNKYAQSLKDLGPLLWMARGGLLLVFVTHIFLSLRLKKRNWDARPVRYQHEDTVEATWASRHMVLTGLLILTFVAFHLAHFTFGWVDRANVEHSGHVTETVNYRELSDENGRHDVYGMVIQGFQNVPISIIYIIFQVILALHLAHGTGSVFQTFGLNHPRYNALIRYLAYGTTAIILIGNISMPVAVMCRWVK
jgi:succinate dehydrogenase / fumarate reductase cytochrome b subunit